MSIYLDYQATTPLAPEALAAMLPWLETGHANPHSAHAEGRRARAAVEAARATILSRFEAPEHAPTATEQFGGGTKRLLGEIDAEFARRRSLAGPGAGRLFFTSGATEALNWAIRGSWLRRPRGRQRVVTIATEHACVLDSVEALASEGAEVVILPVDRLGLVECEAASAAIDDRTAMVVAMLVNNEVGVRQKIDWLGRLAREAGATMICDAVQGFLRTRLPAEDCDLIAISAHKLYGPKGIGALWVREGHDPAPILHGGRQEGARSGTLSPALCVGFAAAVASFDDTDGQHVEALWQVARETLRGPDWVLNGDRVCRYHGNLNVRLPGLDVARLMSDLRDIAFSAGSACASGSGRPSHVLRAIGLSDADARSSIRLGFGRYTTTAELRDAVTRIDAAARAQRVAA